MTGDRHHRFADLHAAGCFVIPNPWDVGSARLMSACGAEALATTSSGMAFTLGRPDMNVTRDEAVTHAEAIVAATPLPVTADFESGFSETVEGVGETVLLGGAVGLSGCSIEDTAVAATTAPTAYPFEVAVNRVTAAVEAARSLDRPFVLCARADGVMNGFYDLAEAIRRIQAFEKAGADLLYVPVPPSPEAQRQIVDSVSKPVNALSAGPLAGLSLDDFARLGVRRVSVGSRVARVTHAAIRDLTRAMIETGDFSGLDAGAAGSDIDRLLADGTATR